MEPQDDTQRYERAAGPRYAALPGNPACVYDTVLNKVSSTHLDFEGAVSRAYILNRFSTGGRI